MELPEQDADQQATHFIIDTGGGDGPNYVLCQRVVTGDGRNGLDAVPSEAIDSLFQGRVLRAVPLETGRFHDRPVTAQLAEDNQLADHDDD